MPYLIGTDEAGYGPNLGPLLIAASVWHTPDDISPADLYSHLDREFCRAPDDSKRMVIADSKLLYKPGSGLHALERGVLSALAALGRPAPTWQAIWPALDACSAEELKAPWHEGYDLGLPLDLAAAELEEATARWTDLQSRTGIALLGVRARAIFPTVFNQGVEQLGNKATLLSTATLELAKSVMKPLGNESFYLHCDKHGGRNRYAALLQSTFSDSWIRVEQEGREESAYSFTFQEQPVTARFVAGGEDFLPSALSSMICKYLRELAMLAFNGYWQGFLPQLKATAGYPADAIRFRAEIAEKARKIGISERDYWRTR